MSTKKVIGRNIKYSAIGTLVATGLQFLLLPFIVSHVGKEIYGAYLLVMTFTGYLGLLDLGVLSAVVKYVAEFKGEGNEEKINEIISASFSFYAVIGVVIGIILFISSFHFGKVFPVEPSNERVVKELLWVTALASPFIWPSRTFEGVLRGLQRYDLRAIINVSVKVCTAIAAYLIFTSGYGMVHFLAISYLLIVLGNLFSYIFAYRDIQSQRIIFPYFNKEVSRTIFSFSSFMFLGSLTNIIVLHIDDFVVGTFVSVAAVTLYNVAYTLQQGLRGINALFGDPLVPACAEMEGRKDYERQKMLLFKGTKYTAAIFLPMVIILIVFARPLVTCWMGEEFEASVLPAQVLLAWWLCNGVINPASGMLTAKGYARPLFNISLINAMSNLVLSLILVRYWGILGVALGTTLPMVLINFPLLLTKTLKVLGIGLREYTEIAVRDNIVIYILALILPVLSLKLYYPLSLFTTLVEMGLIYTVVLGGFIISFRSEERQEILAMIKV